MKEKLLNNYGLKILAVALAIMMWLTIINVIDPSDDKIITGIQVDLINEETLTDVGYTFEVLEGSTISITVDGPTSIIDGLTAADFYASADFSVINPLSDYVDIDVKCIKNNVSLDSIKITLRTSQVKINVENRESRTIDVAVELSGEPAPGFTSGDYDVSPMSIKITGAESVVQSVASVVAEYDISGASMDISDTVNLKLYDEEGNEVSKKGLVLSREQVKLKVPLLVKKVVPINYAYSGNVKDGYKIAGMDYTLGSVVIAGAASAVEAVESIDLPAELIDVSDLSTSKTYSIRVSHYVPSSVKILSEAVADVTVVVEPLVEKEFEIKTSAITLNNKNEAFKYSFIRDSLDVVYSGLNADIGKITADGIKATADVEGLGVGNHTVKVKFETNNDCVAVGEYTLAITVSR